MVAGGITNSFAQNAIAAKISQETEFIPKISENNYANTSNDRIRFVFKSRMSKEKYSDAQLDEIKKDPYKFWEAVYGKDTKKGQSLGNTEKGDGFKYQGRGYVAITGKNNYRAVGKKMGIGDAFVNKPELVAHPKFAYKAAVAYLQLNAPGINDYKTQAEANKAIVRAIGGQKINLDEGFYADRLKEINTYTDTISDNSVGTIIDKSSTNNRELKEQLADSNVLVLINNNTALVKQGDRTTQVYQQRPPYQESAMLQAQRG